MTAFPHRDWAATQVAKADAILRSIEDAKRKQALITRMTVESVSDLEPTPDAPDDEPPLPEDDPIPEPVPENDPEIEGDAHP